MKKIKLFLAIAALVVLGNSCSSDDDSGGSSINQEQLIDTWQIVSLTENGEAAELTDCDLTATVEFTEDEVTFNESFFFGGECETSGFASPYTLDGNMISIGGDIDLDDLPIDLGDLFGEFIDEEDIDFELPVIEITTLNEMTLVIRSTVEEEGDTFVDVTTYRRL